MITKKLSITIGLLLVVFLLLDVTGSSVAKQSGYIGLKKCKMCHNSAKKGAQFKVWVKTKHAQAYKTLGTAEAKKIAKEKGIANPQEDGKCLKCHVTAYGVDASLLGKKFNKEDGVTCEACHGGGADYSKMKVMKQLSANKIDPASVGLIIPTEKVCVTCHNEESPSFKEFNFDEFFKKIAHPMPAEYKTSKGYPTK